MLFYLKKIILLLFADYYGTDLEIFLPLAVHYLFFLQQCQYCIVTLVESFDVLGHCSRLHFKENLIL